MDNTILLKEFLSYLSIKFDVDFGSDGSSVINDFLVTQQHINNDPVESFSEQTGLTTDYIKSDLKVIETSLEATGCCVYRDGATFVLRGEDYFDWILTASVKNVEGDD